MLNLNLARHIDRVRTEPGLKRNVIAMALLLVLAMGAGGWILGNQRFDPPWADAFTFNAEFEAVPGVSPGHGQEVRIAGVIVGQITGAKVASKGHAALTMRLEPGHTVYNNAQLVLRPKSPLNEMYVELTPGTPDSGRLRTGDTIPVSQTHRPVQVDEVLASLDDSTRAALTSLLSESDAALATAPQSLPSGLDQLGTVSEQLRPVAVELDKRREALRALVTTVSQMSTSVGSDDARLAAFAADLDKTLGTVASGSKNLDSAVAQLPDLAARLDSSTAAVADLTKQLDPTLRDVAAASHRLPAALRKVTSTAKTLDGTLDAAEPALALAKPVVADLRPLAADLAVAVPRFETTTARLDPVTAELVKYLPDLGAFMVNTRSLTSLKDANGGILRGMITLTPTTIPNSPLGALSMQQLRRLAR